MPQLLRDLLTEMLDAEPDIEVVTSLHADTDLTADVWRAKADVLIVQLATEAEQALCASLLGSLPHLKVVAISPTATGATMYQLRPACELVGALTSERLLAVVRNGPLPLESDLALRSAGSEAVRVHVTPPWGFRP
jgi:DNA-binding NarL/FixJ family response regulator